MNLLSRIIIKRPGIIVAAALVLATIAGTYGLTVFSKLANGGFEDTQTSSAKSDTFIKQHFGQERTDLLILLTSNQGTVDEPAAADRLKAKLEDIRTTKGVEGVTDYYSTGAASFASEDKYQTFATVRLTGGDSDKTATYKKLEKNVASSSSVTVAYGGLVAINAQINTQVSKDLEKAELLSFPILAILLIVVFRSVIAALIPLALGGLSIIMAFLVIRLLTNVTTVSVYAINIITLLGLGLAIDYSLFIVSRFREELAAGQDVPGAINRTLATAGRTVFFSALTVIISLLGLLVFPQNFLSSMGLGGAAAVGATALLALTVLPATLRLVGRHVNDLALPGLHRRLDLPAEHGIWYRYSRFIMRRPLITLAVALELLAIFAVPFLSATFSTPDATTVPKTYSSRHVDDQLKQNFATAGKSTINLGITTATSVTDPATQTHLADYLTSLKAIDGVSGVTVRGATDHFIFLSVTEYYKSQSANAAAAARDIRALPSPSGWTVESGGQTAALIDLLAGLKAKIPWAAAIIVVATSVLMFLMLGSIIMPIKTVILNVLSLSAAFGILTWIFKGEHLTKLFGFATNGTIDATQPVLIFAIAFGLAMDYELFLLSRIKEEYDRTGDNTTAVAIGVEHTAGIITSAALMLVVVIGLFATGKITIIQQVGVGLAAAVAIDATIVRMVLVPSAMELMGGFNWWAPRPLARLAKRLGISESA